MADPKLIQMHIFNYQIVNCNRGSKMRQFLLHLRRNSFPIFKTKSSQLTFYSLISSKIETKTFLQSLFYDISTLVDSELTHQCQKKSRDTVLVGIREFIPFLRVLVRK